MIRRRVLRFVSSFEPAPPSRGRARPVRFTSANGSADHGGQRTGAGQTARHVRAIYRPSDFIAIMPPGIAGEREGIAPQTSAESFWRQLELDAMARRVYG
jgi:hypothetical protein